MTGDQINNPVIVSEDIFMKAAVRYCERTGTELFGTSQARALRERDALADLAERIMSLKEVGAI